MRHVVDLALGRIKPPLCSVSRTLFARVTWSRTGTMRRRITKTEVDRPSGSSWVDAVQ